MEKSGVITDVEITDNVHQRFKVICEAFEANFRKQPEFFASVPGRVNLIGEHIDYCGYGVLPMAIEQTVVVAARKTDGPLTAISTSSEFQSYEGSISTFEINAKQPRWFNYMLCGIRGIVDSFLKSSPTLGMECIVDGTVPRCAGLSSSSALVCASALAYLRLCNLQATRLELADACQQCERHIGTCGGGMDQAVAFLAEPGRAQYIEFEPSLKATPVSLPDGYTFIVANSCAEINKAATSDFNQRVLETRLAALLLAKALNIPESSWAGHPRPRLADVQRALVKRPGDMMAPVSKHLHEGTYGVDEVAAILGVATNELIDAHFPANTRDVREFWLHKRAEHVYSEAERVLVFRDVCGNAANKSADQIAKELGALMDASHESCCYSYECSHPELDLLVSICRDAGALGSRLTGAGWGGCCVSLVRNADVQQFMNALSERFYAVEEARAPIKDPIENGWLFATKPAAGAVCYKKTGPVCC